MHAATTLHRADMGKLENEDYDGFRDPPGSDQDVSRRACAARKGRNRGQRLRDRPAS